MDMDKKLQVLEADRIQQMIKTRISEEQRVVMMHEVTSGKIKDTLFSKSSSKAPGPCGFSAGFYHKACMRCSTRSYSIFFPNG